MFAERATFGRIDLDCDLEGLGHVRRRQRVKSGVVLAVDGCQQLDKLARLGAEAGWALKLDGNRLWADCGHSCDRHRRIHTTASGATQKDLCSASHRILETDG